MNQSWLRTFWGFSVIRHEENSEGDSSSESEENDARLGISPSESESNCAIPSEFSSGGGGCEFIGEQLQNVQDFFLHLGILFVPCQSFRGALFR